MKERDLSKAYSLSYAKENSRLGRQNEKKNA